MEWLPKIILDNYKLIFGPVSIVSLVFMFFRNREQVGLLKYYCAQIENISDINNFGDFSSDFEKIKREFKARISDFNFALFPKTRKNFSLVKCELANLGQIAEDYARAFNTGNALSDANFLALQERTRKIRESL